MLVGIVAVDLLLQSCFETSHGRRPLHFVTLSAIPINMRFPMDEMQRLLPNNASSSCKTELAVDAGDPAERIVQHARDERADLIVMALAGNSDFNVKDSSGVTCRVAGAAPCPVLAVPAAMLR